jgi:hypothetical protein
MVVMREMERGVIVREDSYEVKWLLAARFESWWAVMVVSMVPFQEE